jgi:hypothetical protein
MPLFIFNILVASCLAYLVLSAPNQTPGDWVKGLPDQISEIATDMNTKVSKEMAPEVNDAGARVEDLMKQEDVIEQNELVQEINNILANAQKEDNSPTASSNEEHMAEFQESSSAADDLSIGSDMTTDKMSSKGNVSPPMRNYMSPQQRQVALAELIEDLQLFAIDRSH